MKIPTRRYVYLGIVALMVTGYYGWIGFVVYWALILFWLAFFYYRAELKTKGETR